MTERMANPRVSVTWNSLTWIALKKLYWKIHNNSKDGLFA